MDLNVIIGIGVAVAVIVPLVVSFLNKPVENKPVRKIIKKTN